MLAISLFNEIFNDKESRNQLHLLWAISPFKISWAKFSIKRAMQRCGSESAVVSIVNMRKERCITKERFDLEYRIPNGLSYSEYGSPSYRSPLTEYGRLSYSCSSNESSRSSSIEFGSPSSSLTSELEDNYEREEGCEDYSLGDDLETFINRIKNEEITNATIPVNGETKQFHLIRLLDKEERRKIERKDKDFMKTFARSLADVPDEEWKKSEYKHLKYSKSNAARVTFIFDAETSNHSLS